MVVRKLHWWNPGNGRTLHVCTDSLPLTSLAQLPPPMATLVHGPALVADQWRPDLRRDVSNIPVTMGDGRLLADPCWLLTGRGPRYLLPRAAASGTPPGGRPNGAAGP